MSLLLATQITAIATAVLALFAVITTVFAYLAFLSQGKQMRILQAQVKGDADMLRVQSDHLDAQHDQLAEMRRVTEKQVTVLALQAEELSAALEQRKREGDDRRRGQASKVTAWFGLSGPGVDVVGMSVNAPYWSALIRNASDQPIFDVRVSFYFVAEDQPGTDWKPVLRGSPPEKIRVIPPGADRFMAIPDQVRNLIDEVSDQIYVVGIEFTDAAGNRWERDPRGALKEF